MRKKSMIESAIPDYVYANVQEDEKDVFLHKEKILKDYIQISLFTFIILGVFTIAFVVWKVAIFKFLALTSGFFFLLGLLGLILSFISIVKEIEVILKKYI